MSLDTLIEDPLTVYDTMREAATRLVARHVAIARANGTPGAEVPTVRAIHDEMDQVGTRDLAALNALRESFDARRESLSV